MTDSVFVFNMKTHDFSRVFTRREEMRVISERKK